MGKKLYIVQLASLDNVWRNGLSENAQAGQQLP